MLGHTSSVLRERGCISCVNLKVQVMTLATLYICTTML